MGHSRLEQLGCASRSDPERGPDSSSCNEPPPPSDSTPSDEAASAHLAEDISHATNNRRRGVSFSRFSTIESIVFVRPRLPAWLIWLRDIFFGSYDRYSDIPSYRTAPMISGSLVPFAILLQIPGITERWYIRTNGPVIVESRPNSAFLDAVLGISFGCAVIANAALIIRFFERRVAAMTIVAIVCLAIHDLINTLVVIIFGVEHRFNDGFTYGEAYWLTACSTVVSLLTVGTLIWDMCRTRNFATSGSGLTRKQRSLIIITMVFLSYTALGALISSLMMNLTFIDGLYFTIVTNLTVGFGDIVPHTALDRCITCLHAAFGIVILGSAVRLIGETVIESLEVGYRLRVREYRRRRREHHKEVREAARWRNACEAQLSAKGVPLWVPQSTHGIEGLPVEMSSDHSAAHALPLSHHGTSTPSTPTPPYSPSEPGMVLNIAALDAAELEDAARTARVPLSRYLNRALQLEIENARESCYPLSQTIKQASQGSITPANQKKSWLSMPRSSIWWARTYHWLTMAKGNDGREHSHLGKMYVDTVKMLELEERKSLYLKLGLAWANFIVFWIVGSAIFCHVESWSFATALYFCFITFGTIGYGDVHPRTALGRSIFVFWSLIGVASMTVLIAVICDAFSSKYRSVMHSKTLDHALRNYQSTHTTHRRSTRRSLDRIVPGIKSNIESLASPSARRQKLAETDLGLEEKYDENAGAHSHWTSPQQPALANPPPTLPDINGRMRQRFEVLPPLMLEEIHLLREQMRYFFSASGHAHGWNEAAGETGLQYQTEGAVPDSLRKLLDEITEGGAMTERMKDELWDDEYARNTLFILGFEKSIRKLVDAAEDAIEILAERDQLVAEQQQQRQGHRTKSPDRISRSTNRTSKSPRSPAMRQPSMNFIAHGSRLFGPPSRSHSRTRGVALPQQPNDS